MKLKITIEQKVYEVEVEVEDNDPRPLAPYAATPPHTPVAAPLPPPAGAPASNGNVAEDKVCRSPIAGIVVRMAAQEGQQVQANDPLMVLEAMKMETTITSPVSGKVKTVHPHAGDSVQAGQILVEFE